MADKKPEGKKPAPAEGSSVHSTVIWFLIILFFLSTFIPYLAFKAGIAGGDNGNIFDPEFVSALRRLGVALFSSIQALSAFVSLLFIIGIIYAKFRTGQIKREAKLKMKVSEVATRKVQQEEETENKKWKRVVEHVMSPNPSDWRLSILEADILLGEVLARAGYAGENIGDMLKSAGRPSFATIDKAWEAHLVRNRIAHDGSDHPLNQGEAKRIISLFEDVFREFSYI